MQRIPSKCAWDKDDLLAAGLLDCVDGKGHEWELTRWQKVEEPQPLTDTDRALAIVDRALAGESDMERDRRG